MLERLLRFSISQRFVVIAAALLLIGVGLSSWQRLTLDAVPDIAPNLVQINTDTGGLGPEEVERLVTFPIETAVSGLPRVTGVRSLSQFGLSQVNVTFDEGVDVYFARQLVSERLNRVQGDLPAGVEAPQMGPVSTGLGEIYMFALESDKRSAMELRSLNDWQVAPQLRTVAGVAEVNAVDGSEKQYQVVLDPQRMRGRNVTVGEIVNALEANNENAGGGVLDRNGERILIRSVGAATDLADVARIPIKTEDGVPVLVRDVAEVKLGTPLLTGIGSKDGRHAMVSTVLMLKGANGRTVSEAVDQKLQEIRGQMPKDVKLTTVYNRADLVNKAVGTLTRSLVEGGLLVITVLVLLLGNFRGAIIAAVAIPMAMLFAIVGMERFGVSGNLMSLGAIDFGIIVDGAVIMVENCIRRLSEARQHLGRPLTDEEHRDVVGEATSEVRKVTQFGEMIIIATFIPIFVLEGTAGKMFKPMALVFVLALIGALILSLTLIPTLCSLFLSRNTVEKHNILMSFFARLYRPLLEFSLRRRWVILTGAAGLLIFSAVLFPRLGSEFIPQLDEGDFVVQPIRVRTVNEIETLRLVTAAERKMREVPEVLTVFSRSGTPEVATDPMPLSLSDSFVMLKPRDQWRAGMTKAKIQAALEEKLEDVPGQGYNFSQPIQMRFSELASGVKADVGIKVVGEDLDILRKKANEVAAVVRAIPGAEDVEVEQVDEIPMLQVTLDRDALARYGVSVAEVQRVIRTALGGAPVGQIIEGDKRFDLRLALPDAVKNSPAEIAALPIRTAVGETVPLASLARIGNKPAPAQISREAGKRRVAIQMNVRGRDLGTTVAAVQRAVRERVQLPEGYYVEYGGQFEELQTASARLAIAVPLALALIFTLLYTTFGSTRQAALIFSGVPLAVTGGIIALALRGMPFSISAGVGFIALSGVAVLNGVVMVAAINRLREQGASVRDAVRTGARERLRPVLMTALVAALGFIPMALNTGIGAEVQRPLATVVIGGILSATLLTLVVLPVLYTLFEREKPTEGGALS